MLYSIHCLDHADKLTTRLRHYDEHRAHLNNASITLVLAGTDCSR